MALVTLPAKDGAKLTVTTPGWKDGEDIAFKYTQYQGNTFPGLEWTKGPSGTKSYAIIMQDPDIAIRGNPVLHWTMMNIPATVTKLEAGMTPEGKPAGSIYGPNYQGLAQTLSRAAHAAGTEGPLSLPGLRAGHDAAGGLCAEEL